MIEGVIFDMDGVLVDNVEQHLEAFLQFGREQGRALTRADVLEVFGQRNDEMIPALLSRQVGEEELARLASRKEEIYRELTGAVLKETMVPGLKHFLQELWDHNVAMSVATSGPRGNVDFVLDGLRIRSFFRGAVTGAEVSHGKPHPEVFLKAAELLQVDPSRCLVFEDTTSGIEAARRAGCRCIAVATTHSREELAVLEPDRILGDFSEIGAKEALAL